MRRSRRSQAVIPTTEPVARNKGGQRVAHAAKSARAHSRGTTVVHNGMDDLREPSKDAAWRDPSKIAACRGSKIAAWREPSNDAAWRTQQNHRLASPAKSPLGEAAKSPLGEPSKIAAWRRVQYLPRLAAKPVITPLDGEPINHAAWREASVYLAWRPMRFRRGGRGGCG